MNINRTPFTHLSASGKIHGDIHHAPKVLRRKGRIVFAHGYKGFKDWGAWDLLGDILAAEGWDFVRFNFSHNGHVKPRLLDCSDEIAWSKNTYSIEKSDLESVLKFVCEGMVHDAEKLIVIGHSRGGGVASLAASNTDVEGLILLASVCDFESRFPSGKALDQWRSSNRLEVINGRTKQVLFHPFSFYEDFIANRDSLNIEASIRSLSCSVLVIHGDEDLAVDILEGQKLSSWARNGKLVVISGADHTFGTSHPWKSQDLPKYFMEMAQAIKLFLAEI